LRGEEELCLCWQLNPGSLIRQPSHYTNWVFGPSYLINIFQLLLLIYSTLTSAVAWSHQLFAFQPGRQL